MATPKRARTHVEDLRGASRLAVEATRGVTRVVEQMHVTIASGSSILGQPFALPVRLWTGWVYGYIRGVTKLVGGGLDVALAQLGPLLGESVPGAERVAVLAALNGVLGDYLRDTGNPLAITPRLRHDGAALELDAGSLRAAFPSAGPRLVVLAHGSSMSDLQWRRAGHDHGAALEADRGYTPVYLHYNSGLHISTNGKAFAALLEALVAAWPVPLEELVLLGFSMGGLVSRSACHYAEKADHLWRRKLTKLVFLGTPHHGAPLERGGSWVEGLLGLSAYSAPLASLGRIRSAGITDLRFGCLLDEDWEGRDRFARCADPRAALTLPAGVECYAIAATRGLEPSERLSGDGLVSVDSALGRHARPELTLAFPAEHQWTGYGMNHFDLLGRREVYEKVRAWL